MGTPPTVCETLDSAAAPAALRWQPDVLDGFEQAMLMLAPAADGPVEIVLVRRCCAAEGTRAVLYLHGFIDYFFQTHLAEFYNRQGLHFYALDMRRHGRSLRPHHLPCFITDINELLADVAAAVRVLTELEGIEWLLLNGHSTGGLVAALFASRGEGRERVNALFLNSPFFEMYLPAWQKRLLKPLLARLGRLAPRLKLARLSPLYAQSIHADYRGEWSFDLRWKPIEGFPVYAGWFRAIHRAHRELARGLAITCPCLVLHAERSLVPRRWSDALRTADVVLDVEDMKRLAPRLGPHVERHAVGDALHDLVLSIPPARARTFELLADWLERVAPAA